jgi:hypothetical protein
MDPFIVFIIAVIIVVLREPDDTSGGKEIEQRRAPKRGSSLISGSGGVRPDYALLQVKTGERGIRRFKHWREQLDSVIDTTHGHHGQGWVLFHDIDNLTVSFPNTLELAGVLVPDEEIAVIASGAHLV